MNGPIDMKKWFEGATQLKAALEAAMERAREGLAQKTVSAETGGGLVRCTANGRGEILSIAIDPSIVRAEDRKMIEDLIVGAVNLALDRAREIEREELARAAGGLPLPSGFPGLGG